MRLTKVLIVDDEPEVLTLLGIILRKRGYCPVECLTGQEAMEQIQKRSFCLGLIDVLLPDMDGLEIIKEAKKRNPLAEMIVMTGCNRIDIAIKAVKYQAYDFLLKPIESELLYCSLGRAKEMINLKLKDLIHKRNLEWMVEERSQRLIQAEKQAIIGNSIQGIVHNILNPLTVIAGRVELLKAELEQISNKDEDANNINESSDSHGSDILETLKKFGQDITAIYQNSQKIFHIVDNILKKYTLERESSPSYIDINNLIIQEMEFFKSDLYFKHQVKKSYDLDPTVGKVNMVYSHLSQVLDNLVKNGIEAMYESEKKEITIRTYQDDERIFLSVKDTGIGIPENLKEKVFEPFFSTKTSLGDSSTQRRRVGYGLGLHSCLELLKPYGGDIWLESEPGLGSELTIVLPKSISFSEKIDNGLSEDRQTAEKQEINIKGQLLNILAEGKI
jgi:signal transduction histidine kinase